MEARRNVTPLEVLQRYPAHDYTLHGLLASRSRADADRTVVEFRDARVSYAEMRERVHATMALLASRGVKGGDRIAVMSTNHPGTVALLIALASMGATMV